MKFFPFAVTYKKLLIKGTYQINVFLHYISVFIFVLIHVMIMKDVILSFLHIMRTGCERQRDNNFCRKLIDFDQSTQCVIVTYFMSAFDMLTINVVSEKIILVMFCAMY